MLKEKTNRDDSIEDGSEENMNQDLKEEPERKTPEKKREVSPELKIRRITKHLDSLERTGEIDSARKDRLISFIKRMSPERESSREALPKIKDPRRQFDSSFEEVSAPLLPSVK